MRENTMTTASGSGGPLLDEHVICPGCAHNFKATSPADAERIRKLETALGFYARGGNVVGDVADAARGDIDLARASEALTEDCGDVAREALKS